jgi:hypothetical protein
MSAADLPSGSHRVCPRCGTPTGDGVWCDGCGLNLKQQAELPTADAYAAKVREQRWLEERREEERAEPRQKAKEKKAARERREAETAAAQQRAADEKAEKRRARAEARSRRGTRPWVVAGIALVALLLAGGVGTYALTSGSDPDDQPLAPTETGPETTRTGDQETNSGEGGFGAEPADEEPLSQSSPLSTEGLGPILAGMSLDEAEEAAGTRLTEGPTLHGDCQYLSAEGLNGVSFMHNDGEIARVDVTKPVVATLSGIRVGDTEAEVIEEYGDQISVQPSELNPGYSTLTFTPSDPSDKTRTVFTTDGSKVTAIHAGRLPEVEFIEGCV